MKKYCFKSAIISLLLMFSLAAGLALPCFAVESQLDSLLSAFETDFGSIQEYIDGELADNAGTPYADWTFIALMRHSNSFNTENYISALDNATYRRMNNTEKERVALAYTVAESDRDFVATVLESDFSSTGINGVIYGLILLDAGAYNSKTNDRDTLINEIISSQLQDGGWALSGSSNNIDVTAMALQALAPYMSYDDVSTAISKALDLISKTQDSDGGYRSMGKPTCESTVQVIIALTSLGINPETDRRFIKNGNSTIDALSAYQLSTGYYSHFQNTSDNAISTAQSLCALVAIERYNKGQTSFFRDSSSSVERAIASADSGIIPNESSAVTDISSDAGETKSIDEETDSSISVDNTDENIIQEAIVSTTKKVSYKYYACGAVVISVILIVSYMFVKKKLNIGNIVAIAVVAVLLISGILFLNITSVQEHYSAIQSGDNTCSLTIYSEAAATDRNILNEAEYQFSAGDSVFDVLLNATKANHIKLEYSGNPESKLYGVYISGIDNVVEMQYGPLSGWVYTVNGYYPDISCSDYFLKNGDIVEFIYTCGEDEVNE